MPAITLPDGSVKQFDQPVTGMQVAESIGAGLAKATLAARIDGRLADACVEIDHDAEVALITARDREGLDIIRHSCAHLLGQALKTIYPNVQMAIGPVIDDGFYYDIAIDRTLTPEDLEKIEARMYELAERDHDVIREVVTREKALATFEARDEPYKQEIVRGIPEGETIALYHHEDYTDMCVGPHVPNSRHLRAFKLTSLAGAYWRGDADNEMLTRIYGTAWANKKDLKAHLAHIEEAKKRDHRLIGRRQELFHIQEEAPGMVFWHDRGWQIYLQITDYIRARLKRQGYREVHTPSLIDLSLWEKSGHADKFMENMFITGSEERQFAVKPMNCPAHVQIYNRGLKSYRDLPLRLAEFGSCHRNEASGTLHGLMRVRGFTQDDAHIFCTEAQIGEEVGAFIDLLYTVYRDFGFDDVLIKLSTRPEKRVGSDAVWDKSEAALQQCLEDKGLDFELQPGEGAFYGPKIEFSLRDCLSRVWQLGTVQLDFSMPARLGAEYVDENGDRQVPVMIHRAILGSLERFIGILIEHYAGSMPVWLSPSQAVLLNITDAQADFVTATARRLRDGGLRVDTDLRNEKIGYKIREHTMQRVPFLLVVGDREVESGSVAVRTREGEDLGTMSVEAFLAMAQERIDARN
ncbi:Threonine--tRNA ligase protein [Salinisphaera shabanensis E1L3A]|uniref:Threonine--tRNA ligase n=1 Tax=Salinisphaera shabanensis E1L3A TaxID=1033802 RepID=U2FVA6_9GAMM|nr:threonine--tRNA ligase [Salinisphaera shabanensis]ERJ18253.1 Threonine--tRNA ligase protein [Salinisphaera shabanensis E1L3A]